MNDYFTLFYVKHFELPLCMKCAIQINLPCLALPCLKINVKIGLTASSLYVKANVGICFLDVFFVTAEANQNPATMLLPVHPICIRGNIETI